MQTPPAALHERPTVQTLPAAATARADVPPTNAAASSDVETPPRALPEPPTAPVQTSQAAATTLADVPVANATVSADVQIPAGALPEPPNVSNVEHPPTGVVGIPTYAQLSEAKADQPRITKTEVESLLSRGDTLFRAGDVTAARLFYQRGAEAGDGTAALRLGETFDPEFLKRAHLSLVRGDAAKAMNWYHRAAELDEPNAKALLGNLSVSDK
jgi:TPR repeat protein